MRALVVNPQQQLEPGEVPEPQLHDGDLLVQVKAAGVNRADLLQRVGRYPPPPGEPEIIGLEIAGEVLEPAARRGERIMALLAGGGYAERARVPAAQAMPVPRGLDFAQAAAIPEAYLTAWLNVFMIAQLKPGENVVVHAGASGVGSAALQLCHGVAGTLLATSSNGKEAACRSFGATQWLARDEVPHRLAQAIQADVILDTVGAAYLEANISALRLHGRLCCISTMSGAKATLDMGLLLYKRLSILGSTLRSRTAAQKAKLVRDFSEKALPRFDQGELKPVLAKTFPFAQAMSAHDALQKGEVVGKIVLVP
ncbi:MAG TPA: NAD(P)H-quinone oxidoreductase [Myxococcales bacterium]|nr:NAD(P)H-quinone oxidoreductase [Myxococcales bacterium]